MTQDFTPGGSTEPLAEQAFRRTDEPFLHETLEEGATTDSTRLAPRPTPQEAQVPHIVPPQRENSIHNDVVQAVFGDFLKPEGLRLVVQVHTDTPEAYKAAVDAAIDSGGTVTFSTNRVPAKGIEIPGEFHVCRVDELGPVPVSIFSPVEGRRAA